MAGNPHTAWADAERFVFQRLMTDTGTKEGQSAFLTDALPDNRYWCWRLNTGGGSARSTWSGCFGSLIMGGEIEGRFKTRAEAQEFAQIVMTTLSATDNFNRKPGSNLQWFRMDDGGMPTVEQSTFVPANSKGQELTCYIVRIGVQMVYNLKTTY